MNDAECFVNDLLFRLKSPDQYSHFVCVSELARTCFSL